MSQWNHSICDKCWEELYPGRRPIRISQPCCYCGEYHHSGILVRDDPKNVACQGEGANHEEDE